MTAAKMHVKKGDKVLVLSGKDKGKEGKIIMALPKKSKVVVEGINKVKRHTKPRAILRAALSLKKLRWLPQKLCSFARIARNRPVLKKLKFPAAS